MTNRMRWNGIRNPWLVLATLGVVVISASCYRAQAPAELGQAVRVEITSNDARLVRSQSYLQRAVADALANRLGWTVSPTGSARLQLTIEREEISSSGTDQRNTPSRWTVELRGQALLTSQHAPVMTTWTGTGYTSALSSTTDDEASALRTAATNASLMIATWLEAEMRQKPTP